MVGYFVVACCFRIQVWVDGLGGVGDVMGLLSIRFVGWGGWGLSCLFALRGGGLFVGLKGLCAVVGVMKIRFCKPRAVSLHLVWDGEDWGVLVFWVYHG